MTFKGEYILCAAIHFQDGKIYHSQPKNVANGLVIAGRRHHNCFATLSAAGLWHKSFLGYRLKAKRDLVIEMGFITSWDRYVDRHEAFKIAESCDQVEESIVLNTPPLSSEDLY